MRRLCSVVALIGGLIGALFIYVAMSAPGTTAIQEAAFAAVGVGFAVIPYCITRSIQLLIDSDDAQALQQIQSSLVEIRSGLRAYQTGVSPTGSNRATTTESTPRETIARPEAGMTTRSATRETIVHPEAGVTRQEEGIDLEAIGRIFEETKNCPSCSEPNQKNARVCFSCGSVIPHQTAIEEVS